MTTISSADLIVARARLAPSLRAHAEIKTQWVTSACSMKIVIARAAMLVAARLFGNARMLNVCLTLQIASTMDSARVDAVLLEPAARTCSGALVKRA